MSRFDGARNVYKPCDITLVPLLLICLGYVASVQELLLLPITHTHIYERLQDQGLNVSVGLDELHNVALFAENDTLLKQAVTQLPGKHLVTLVYSSLCGHNLLVCHTFATL